MPVRHFKSMEAYKKYEAFKHIHGLAKKKHPLIIYIKGKRHYPKNKGGK